MKKNSSSSTRKSVSKPKSKASLTPTKGSKGSLVKGKRGSKTAAGSPSKPAKNPLNGNSSKKSTTRQLQKSPSKSAPTAKVKPKVKSVVTGKQRSKPKVSKSPPAKKPIAKRAGKSTVAPKKAKASPVASKQIVAKKLSGTKPAIKTPLKKAPEKKITLLQDYSQFRAILLEKRRRLYGDVAMMSEEALGSEEATVDNHAPIHPAEVGSHSFEQEFTLGLLSRDGDKIRLVDLALEKMAEGSYGLCDECGGRIPKGRLEMLPESIYCVKCASRLEGSGP